MAVIVPEPKKLPRDVQRNRRKWTVIYRPDPKLGPSTIKPGIHGRFDNEDDAHAAADACHTYWQGKCQVIARPPVDTTPSPEADPIYSGEFDDAVYEEAVA